MSLDNHSKAPWFWDKELKELDSASGAIINYEPYEGMMFVGEDWEIEANARLIASAPDLLTALEAVRDCHHQGNDWYFIPKATVRKIEAAIKKAKGRV